MLISTKRILPAALAGTIALTGALAATQPASAAAYVVPGAPGVANVSVVQGNVVIERGDGAGQFGATINTPLLPGDYISTAGYSRTEVQFDGISMLRLAENTQVRFVNLDPRSREMQLAIGTAELAALRGADGGPQLDTPSLTVRPNRTGDYRVSVLDNGETLVTVRSGAVTIATGSGTQILRPGSTLIATGAYANPAISYGAPVAYDAFDAFNQRRDAAIVASYDANGSIAPEFAGYANFASYGQWYNVPNYGEVWAPSNQAYDWSPYSNGQWVWEPGYGYTWVGNEPWGYVPYHYGNWFYSTAYNRWMWQPPAYQYQTNADVLAASWLPALVGFFLTGGNSIGWVPLAPGEPYVPWYRGFEAGAAYPAYAVNNVTNIINVYRNIRYVKIVRIYDFDRFRDGDWHHPIIMHPDRLTRVAVLHGSLPIVPTKALLRSGTVAARPIVLSSRFHEQRFASHAPVLATMTVTKAQKELQSVVSKPPVHTVVPMHTMAPRPVHTQAPYRPGASRVTRMPHATALRPAHQPQATATKKPEPEKTQKPA